MRILYIFCFSIFLAGCDQYYFSKKDITDEQFLKDHYECLLEIGSLQYNKNIRFDAMEKMCMRIKGYTVSEEKPEKAILIDVDGR